MAASAVETVKDVGGSGNFLSIRGGVLKYKDTSFPDNKMRCIILHSVLENQHYAVAFDPSKPASPDCYAFGTDRDDMIPHEAVAEPYHETCKGCPNKAFGSADRGKGKACGDVERLALIPESDLDNIEDAEIAFLKVPYYSTIEHANYVRSLEDTYHRPTMAFITELTVIPDPTSQFRIKFNKVEELEGDDVFEALFNRLEKVKTEIVFPYPKFEEGAAETAKPAPKPAPVKVQRTVQAPPVTQAAGNGKVKVGAKRPVKQPKY